jgi:AraC-like DNA-binding protein
MNRDLTIPARWRVRTALAHEVQRRGAGWWWDNRIRPPGACVFQYVREGGLDLRVGRRRLRVPPGSVALLRFGDDSEYGLASDAPADYVGSYVTLLGAGLPEHWQELISRHGPCVLYGPEVLAAALALIEAADPRRAVPPSALATQIHAFVMQLYDGALAADGGARPAVDQAIDAILASPTHPLSLKEIAGRHGISREHLTRAFVRRVGEPPWTWITRARLAHARGLLAETGLPVAEVARLSGYASARVLARNLVEATGRSPAVWRTA